KQKDQCGEGSGKAQPGVAPFALDGDGGRVYPQAHRFHSGHDPGHFVEPIVMVRSIWKRMINSPPWQLLRLSFSELPVSLLDHLNALVRGRETRQVPVLQQKRRTAQRLFLAP